METISATTLHALFAIHKRNSVSNMQRTLSGDYHSYYTQLEYNAFVAGFTQCHNMYAGDNK